MGCSTTRDIGNSKILFFSPLSIVLCTSYERNLKVVCELNLHFSRLNKPPLKAKTLGARIPAMLTESLTCQLTLFPMVYTALEVKQNNLQ